MFRKTVVVILAVCIVALSGCSLVTAPAGDSVIATSFYPVYIFTLNLVDGIDGVTVMCMAEQSVGCLHDYTITAKDARIIDDADVLVINGAGMELFVEDIYTSAENLTVIDSSEGVELLCGDSHEGHDHHDHEGHSHEYNSHIWMSVGNAKVQVTNIKNGLIEKFPQFKEKIESNYDDYMMRLDALAEDIDEVSQYVNDKPVMTFHDAYAYLAEDMGFHVVSTVESGEGGEPSAMELASLSDEINEHGVKALFIEPDYSGSAAEILFRETGVEIYTLNPVIKGDAVKTAYEDIMRKNIESIVEAVK
jgi:zinc transport system substrate-binding protein